MLDHFFPVSLPDPQERTPSVDIHVSFKEDEMRYIIVTTCGTSSITNGAPGDLQVFLRNTANTREKDLSPEEEAVIDDRLEKKRQELKFCPENNLRSFCAELNGLLGILNDIGRKSAPELHFILHTDTYQGEKVASLLADWCSEKGIRSQTVLVQSLNTKNLSDFKDGISRLIEWCHDTLPGYRDSGHGIIFNLVGGFKSLQGYMQTIGMIFADESVYVFEGERELLRIPRLPLDLDSSCRSVMHDNLLLFRRLSSVSPAVPEAKCAGLPETFFYCFGGECELSPWGKILWEKFRETVYREKLLASPSDSLRFGEKLKKQVETLDPSSTDRVNRKIDELSRFLEKSEKKDSLSFKLLQGNPVPGCTHEFYLWSDKDAARGFGYYDNGVFVFDQMRSHL